MYATKSQAERLEQIVRIQRYLFSQHERAAFMLMQRLFLEVLRSEQ